ncbi:MAG TPA: type II toxin-antitoxin system VapC family toxin [Candidatus Binataceae bacterium]|nr:type II toxin-antitoxin system VapC family toxin [Candidatus Binataceae bacterium]
MTAIDTNVLVRIITNDDRSQAARAVAFLRRQNRIYIPKTVLLELEWVLRSAYRTRREAIAPALRAILGLFNVDVEDETSVRQAIEWYEEGMDFADGLHVASAGRERRFATFDNSLRRRLRRPGANKLAEI